MIHDILKNSITDKVEVQKGDVRKTMAARGLVNGRVPTKWEGFSFPNVTLLNLPVKKRS
ncbi:MAG: hypothetical protein ACI3ZP_11120 [Candidatus Cryptobacteroides sp.]